MNHTNKEKEKTTFLEKLRNFLQTLTDEVSTESGDWSIKGFIDRATNIYTISSDTKIISKIIEIQLFPQLFSFAESAGYTIIPAKKQNWYPDLSFINKSDTSIRFAVDIKTTYRLNDNSYNGFTLGSHGEYFRNRQSEKNIQFPYGSYLAHLTLGAIYTRACGGTIDETKIKTINEINSITSVINQIVFFAEEKWKIASDKSGSGNTANIGSIKSIPDLLSGRGVFENLGEKIFDEYWMNHGILRVPDPKKENSYKNLTKIEKFLTFKGLNFALNHKAQPKIRNKS